jgi:hypothetical protein
VPLSRAAASELIVDRLFPAYLKESERLDLIDCWLRWKHEPVQLPRTATRELRKLAEISRTPWLSLIVSSLSQCLYVDGFRSDLDQADPDSEGLNTRTSPPWETWLANDMGRRQVAIHRAALGYGYAFVRVLPGVDTRGKRSVLRGVSPRNAYASYEDPAADDWPVYVIQVESRGEGKGYLVQLFDDEEMLTFTMGSSTDKPVFVKREGHGANVTPFVRFANHVDLDGRCDGEVEPHIPLAARINKTSYDRLLTQHFASWKIRTISGMAEPADDEEANRTKLKLRQDDLLISDDPDTKFGTLDETPLNGFIDAWRSDIEALAAVTQTPTHALTGQLVNLSAEALAAARAGQTQRVAEKQKSLGGSHVQVLRLSARLEGFDEYADDVSARVTWQDMEIRSLSQSVDALGKAAQMLGVPLEALWQRIPGVEKSDVDEWVRMAREADPMDRLAAQLERQAQPATRPPGE